jgi:TolB protein
MTKRVALAVGLALVTVSAGAPTGQAKPKPRPVVLRPFQIYLIRPDGTKVRHVANRSQPFQYGPVWSRDGKRIAFTAYDGGDEPLTLYTIDSQGKHLLAVTSADTDNGLTASSPTWGPAGRLACILTGYKPIPGTTLPPPTLTIVPDITVIAPAIAAAWSPNGQSFAYSDGSRLLTVATDGSGVHLVTSAPRPFTRISDPAWSPNGGRIAFTASGQTGSAHVFVVGRDGTGLVDLTGLNQAEFSPVWSPGGKRLALIQSRASGTQIATVASDGSHLRSVKRLPAGAYDASLSWSSGNLLAFSFQR